MGVVVALLLAAAWFGHAFLMTVVLNVWYALPLRRRYHKMMRAVVALTVFGFPVVLVWLYGGEFLAGDTLQVFAQRPVLFAYFAVCWFTTLIYLPIISI